MSQAALAAALRRERLIALIAMLLVAALAWGYLLYLAAQMRAMAMPAMANVSMSHLQMMSPALAPWSWPLAAYLFAMWFVMMVGMMTPSAAPLVLLYLGVARHAASSGHRFASGSWLFAGYLLAWAAFSLLATLLHWWLESAALMAPTMQAANSRIGGAVLLAAGLYQWLPMKNLCLTQCRAPLQFIQQHGGFQRGAGSSLRLGFVHGSFCVGCCWLLMLMLFVVGVMNLLWIAGLALLVLLEKITPRALWIVRVTGIVAIAGGIWLLLR